MAKKQTKSSKKASIELDNSMEKYMPFLVEIRKRLFFAIAVFFIATILGFVFYERTIKVILSIFTIEGLNIVFTSPFEYITLAVNSGLLFGFIVVFPLIIIQALAFLKPALRPKEYKMVILLLPISITLFLLGFSYGVFIMKFMIELFYVKAYSLNVGNILDVNRLLSLILLTSILMGTAFQFPIVLTVLLRLKVVAYEALVRQRLWAHMSGLLFAIVLPPTDILSLIFLFLPIAILYEITLLLNRPRRKA